MGLMHFWFAWTSLANFVQLIPCRAGENELSAPAIAKLFFEHVVRLYGVPLVVLHDRDPRFTAAFWKELWKILGCKMVFSSAFHPQTDGQTERHNRTIEQVVQALGHEHGLNWLEAVPTSGNDLEWRSEWQYTYVACFYFVWLATMYACWFIRWYVVGWSGIDCVKGLDWIMRESGAGATTYLGLAETPCRCPPQQHNLHNWWLRPACHKKH